MPQDMHLEDASLFKQQAFIDGAWVGADSGATFEVTNPSSGAVLGDVPKMGVAETKRAIEAASRALPAWRDRTAKQRAVEKVIGVLEGFVFGGRDGGAAHGGGSFLSYLYRTIQFSLKST